MMARRPDETEGDSVRPFQDGIHRRRAGACCGQSYMKGFWTDDRVGIDLAAAVLGELFDRLHLFRGVYLVTASSLNGL